MSEMVERVAAAIFCSHIGGNGWPEGLPENAKDYWRKEARAAIEAMREPTEAMIDKTWREQVADSGDPDGVWRVMIDAALAVTNGDGNRDG